MNELNLPHSTPQDLADQLHVLRAVRADLTGAWVSLAELDATIAILEAIAGATGPLPEISQACHQGERTKLPETPFTRWSKTDTVADCIRLRGELRGNVRHTDTSREEAGR